MSESEKYSKELNYLRDRLEVVERMLERSLDYGYTGEIIEKLEEQTILLSIVEELKHLNQNNE